MHQPIVLRFSGDREDFKGTLLTFTAPADQVGFERTYATAIGRFAEEQRAEWMLWFIWRAWRRETGEQLEFEAFLEALVEYELPDEAEEPAPVPPDAARPPA